MYNHNKAQQSKNRVHISWDILYTMNTCCLSEYVVCLRCTDPLVIWIIIIRGARCVCVFFPDIPSPPLKLNRWQLEHNFLFSFKDCMGLPVPLVGLGSCHDWSWWRHQMETYSVLLSLCAGNSPVIGEFPSQGSVTRGFDVLFDLSVNKRLSKQSWGW